MSGMKHYKETADYINKMYNRQSQLDESLADQMRESEKIADATSQWRLMWRKFKRNRIAVVGGIVVLLFYLVALFGDFIAPHTLEQRMTRYSYLPPQKYTFLPVDGFNCACLCPGNRA